MWITKGKLNGIRAEEYTNGIAIGYKHGWQMAIIDANNHLAQYGIRLEWLNDLNIIVAHQIDSIMEREDF